MEKAISDDWCDYTYKVTCEPETEVIRGNASAVDPGCDQLVEDWILNELAAGNEWAWCAIFVTTSVEIDGETIEGTASLGCCSYEYEDDFTSSDYYAQLCEEAFNDLLAGVNAR